MDAPTWFLQQIQWDGLAKYSRLSWKSKLIEFPTYFEWIWQKIGQTETTWCKLWCSFLWKQPCREHVLNSCINTAMGAYRRNCVLYLLRCTCGLTWTLACWMRQTWSRSCVQYVLQRVEIGHVSVLTAVALILCCIRLISSTYHSKCTRKYKLVESYYGLYHIRNEISRNAASYKWNSRHINPELGVLR